MHLSKNTFANATLFSIILTEVGIFYKNIYYIFCCNHVSLSQTLTNLDDHAQTQDVSANSTGNGMVAASATQLLCSLIPEELFEKTVLQTRVQDIAG